MAKRNHKGFRPCKAFSYSAKLGRGEYHPVVNGVVVMGEFYSTRTLAEKIGAEKTRLAVQDEMTKAFAS